jgi:diguanylate cyclase (GGDEF)-like protein
LALGCKQQSVAQRDSAKLKTSLSLLAIVHSLPVTKSNAAIELEESDLRVGLKSSQIAMSIVLITVLTALGFAALRNAEARDREAAFLTQVEIATGALLDAQQSVVILTDAINRSLEINTAVGIQDALANTEAAIEAVDAADPAGIEVFSSEFYEGLITLKTANFNNLSSRAEINFARSQIVSDSRVWLNRYQTTAVQKVRELAIDRATNERNQAALLLITLFMSVWLLTWIGISVGRSYRKAREIITSEELKVASARSALQHASDQLTYQATHDSLTGLPNRNALAIELAQAIENSDSAPLAVFFCDLDRFKIVNDSLGHTLGDELLVEAAGRIVKAVDESTFVSRFGGDEFVILVRDVENQSAAIRVAERIVRALAKPFDVQGADAFIGASVGIAISSAGSTANQLLANADAAMYRAKVSPNHIQVYEQTGTPFSARFDTENALRHAIENKELVVHWQPIVNLKNGQVHTLEALLRWDRPGSGLLMPAEFMAIAEDTGIIVDIGKWVIASACTTGALTDDRSVAVNVSARQLRDVNLVDDLREILKNSKLPPEKLIIEVTEHTVIDPKIVNAPLQRIRELGVRVALDDFGTGYSSLSLLDRLPVDIVKLDRSFMRNLIESPTSQAIVKSLVNLTSALDMMLIVEGVETDTQRRLLRSLGVQHGQGFWFGQPEPGRLLRSRASE